MITEHTLADAARVCANYDGAITAPELAHELRVPYGKARAVINSMMRVRGWVPLGESATNARCYGPRPDDIETVALR